MARFQFQDVMNIIQPPNTTNGIAGLINEILILDEKLRAPELQSEYFRWGIQHHRDHLSGLLKKYSNTRDQFNQCSTSDFLREIDAQQQRIRDKANMTPLFARAIIRASAENIIAQMNDMISMKKIITDQLPTIDDLKTMPELLEALLQVPQK